MSQTQPLGGAAKVLRQPCICAANLRLCPQPDSYRAHPEVGDRCHHQPYSDWIDRHQLV